jgi:3-methyl-2-oxobutanoate hydroxymethyltransferase
MMMSTVVQGPKRVTTLTFKQKKQRGEPISVMTAYDYSTALSVEKAGIDCILVGDSVGMVVLGYENTLSVTMEDMLHHCKAVKRGASIPLLVGDMPFMSFQISPEEALRNAGRFIQEAGMDAIKLEGGMNMVSTIEKIVQAGIPVMGHLGLTPQSINQFGGFRSQGTKAISAEKIYEDAIHLEEAGCFAMVLESIPSRLAEAISRKVSIPTIGIGAGPHCDGQVLVIHDLLGLYDRGKPRFAKAYANLSQTIVEALTAYKNEVENREFPGPEHSMDMTDEEWAKFSQNLLK